MSVNLLTPMKYETPGLSLCARICVRTGVHRPQNRSRVAKLERVPEIDEHAPTEATALSSRASRLCWWPGPPCLLYAPGKPPVLLVGQKQKCSFGSLFLLTRRSCRWFCQMEPGMRRGAMPRRETQYEQSEGWECLGHIFPEIVAVQRSFGRSSVVLHPDVCIAACMCA